MADGFPEFPQLFSEKEEDRLTKLREEEKKIAEAYKSSYTPTAWDSKSWFERGIRRLGESGYIPEWIGREQARKFEAWTPFVETGFTPEMADRIRSYTTEQIQELERKQKIADRLPSIRNYMEALAFAGLLTGESAQLYQLIDELNPQSENSLKLTEEERKWFTDYAEYLGMTSVDSLLENGMQFPSAQTIQDLLDRVAPPEERVYLSQEQVLSSVAFMQDTADIQRALALAHPINKETVAEDMKDNAASKIWDEMVEKGLVPTGDIEKDIKILDQQNKKEALLAPENRDFEIEGQEGKFNFVLEERKDLNTLLPAGIKQLSEEALIDFWRIKDVEEWADMYLDDTQRKFLDPAILNFVKSKDKSVKGIGSGFFIEDEYGRRVKVAQIDENGLPVELTEEEQLKQQQMYYINPDSFDRMEALLPTVKPIVIMQFFELETEQEVDKWLDMYLPKQLDGKYRDYFHTLWKEGHDPYEGIGEYKYAFASGWANVAGSFGSVVHWLGTKGLGEIALGYGEELQKQQMTRAYVYSPQLERPEDLNWKNFFSKDFWLTIPDTAHYYSLMGVQNAPFTLSFIAAAIGMGAVIASPIGMGLGAVGISGAIGTILTGILTAGGVSLLTSSAESAVGAADIYDQLIDRGASIEEADEKANQVFKENMATLLGTNALEVGLAFAPTKWVGRLGKLFNNKWIKGAFIGGKLATISLTESGQEVLQEYFSRKALGEEWEFDDEVKDIAIVAGLMGLGFGGAGHILSPFAENIRKGMSPEAKTKFEADVKAEGELKAIANYAETVEGKERVSQAAKVTQEQMYNELGKAEIHTEEINSYLAVLNDINQMIDDIDIEIQAIATKMKRIEETAADRVSNKTLENNMTELIEQRTRLEADTQEYAEAIKDLRNKEVSYRKKVRQTPKRVLDEVQAVAKETYQDNKKQVADMTRAINENRSQKTKNNKALKKQRAALRAAAKEEKEQISEKIKQLQAENEALDRAYQDLIVPITELQQQITNYMQSQVSQKRVAEAPEAEAVQKPLSTRRFALETEIIEEAKPTKKLQTEPEIIEEEGKIYKRREITYEDLSEAEKKELMELRQEGALEAANEAILDTRVSGLTYLIKRSGKHKGELGNLTVEQYKKLTGKRSVQPNILTPDKKHVMWEYSLDDIATEYGFDSGEAFKYAIESAYEAKQRRNKLRDRAGRIKFSKAKEKTKKNLTLREKTGELWGKAYHVERADWVKAAGVEKTAVPLEWDNLTTMQQDLIIATPFPYVEEMIKPNVLKDNPTEADLAKVENDSYVNLKAESEQADNLFGITETNIPRAIVESIVPQETSDYVKEILSYADPESQLDKAFTVANMTGDLLSAYLLMPDNIAGAMDGLFGKDAPYEGTEFQDTGYWNFMTMDTNRVFSFADWGDLSSTGRRFGLRPVESGHRAYLNVRAIWQKRYMELEQKTGFDKVRPIVGKKKFNQNTFDVMNSFKQDYTNLDNSEILSTDKDISKALTSYSQEEQDVILNWARELRLFWDEVLMYQNMYREKMGLDPIEYRDNYVSWAYRVNLWGKFRGMFIQNKHKKHGVDVVFDNIDYVTPDKSFVGHALPREIETEIDFSGYEQIKDVRRLFIDYTEVASKDMFFTPILRHIKSFARYTAETAPNFTNWLIDWGAQGYAGTLAPLSRAMRQMPFRPATKSVLWLRRRLTDAVFPLNLKWNLFVQTSSIALTVLQAGVGNTFRAMEYFVNKDVRYLVENELYTMIIKRQREGMMIYQDIGNQIRRSKAAEKGALETIVDWTNFVTGKIEQKITGLSCYAGYLKGKKMGYTGSQLLDFASEIGAKTQSMYNIQNVPGLLRIDVLTALFPFQTFCVEVMNSMREITAIKHLKAGAYETIAADTAHGKGLLKNRVKRMMEFFATCFAINVVFGAIQDRRPWQWNSFLPMSQVLVAGVDPFSTWNLPLPYRFAYDVQKGIKNIMEHDNWEYLISTLARYTVKGGVQIDRMLWAIKANIDGEVTDVAGDPLFEVRQEELLKSLLLGVYATDEGKEWKELRFSTADKTTKRILKDLDENEAKLGTSIESRYYTLSDYGTAFMSMVENEHISEWQIMDDDSLYPDLARFRYYCELLWEDYYKLPSNKRLAYRHDNPYIDASLVFWERNSRLRTKEAEKLLGEMYDMFEMDKHPRWHYTGLPEIPDNFKLLPE